MKKFFDQVKPKWIFLTGVLLLYVILFLINPSLGGKAIEKFLSLLMTILPALAIVFGLMIFFNLFFDLKRVAKLLGAKSGIKGWLVSIIAGILSTGPIYAWYPLLSDLQKKGMSNSLIAAFLYNRAVKLPLIPIMIQYFGLPFTLILTFYMVVFSVINGIITGRLVKLKKR